MRKLLLATIVVCFSLNLNAQINSIYFDTRDGQEYQTVIYDIETADGTIIQREWFAENLNYESENSYCYKDYRAYCNTYGRLYPWEDAMDVCPAGWHLSTSDDWKHLYRKYGGSHKAGAALRQGGESALNLIMGGFGEIKGKYIDIGVNCYYWKRTDLRASAGPGIVTIYSDIDEVLDQDIGKSHKNSIRCVKDYHADKVD